MRYDTRYRSRGSLFDWSFPTGVKWLVIANVAIFLVDFFGSFIHGDEIFGAFALVPIEVKHGAIWQVVTYLFLHSLTDPLHILLNMLGLWMFGSPIEQTWGTPPFSAILFSLWRGRGCLCVARGGSDLQQWHEQPTIGRVGRHLRFAAGVRNAVSRAGNSDHVPVPMKRPSTWS